MAKIKIILSAGGTGGHIYPAVAVAEELKKELGERVELLFVGAEGKMEMERIPALGYPIVGLPVVGLQRKLSLANLALPFKVWKSVRRARSVIREFGADLVVGFGGYASGPVLWSAQRAGLPTLIQEQNSYAGLTNKILGKRAKRVCVAYEGMERFFPSDKIVLTGNPLRGGFSNLESIREDAYRYFSLDPQKKTVLVVGGSLGTRSLNEMMKRWVEHIAAQDKYQVMWQTGSYYNREMNEFMTNRSRNGLWIGAFIERMDYAYSAADVVLSRSGALSVSELSLVGKPTIFVPSPNVAEDHQTQNALALTSRNAAVMLPDSEALERGIPLVEELLADEQRREELSKNIEEVAEPQATPKVVAELLALLQKEQ